MRVIDLTQTISASMPVFPGTAQPTLRTATTVAKEGFRETELCIYSHVGTHMDAPAHILPGKQSLDSFPAEQFVGKALVIDCRDVRGVITMRKLQPVRELADKAEFLLFYTGWDVYWHLERYFEGFPVLAPEVAEYAAQSGKKGVGIDAISVEPVEASGLPIHRIMLETDRMVLVENLRNLGQLGEGLLQFMALPLKFENADGAPVRAVGVVED